VSGVKFEDFVAGLWQKAMATRIGGHFGAAVKGSLRGIGKCRH